MEFASIIWTGTAAALAILIGAIVGLIIWIVLCYFIGRAAERKNRSYASFFLIAFFVSPILAAVIVAALPPSREMEIAKGRLVACTECAEAIQPEARICPFCRAT
jgi:MFS family permease